MILADLLTEHQPRPITPQVVLETAATLFGLTVEDITGKARTRDLVDARHIAMYVCRQLTNPPLSFPQIAKAFGGRDHTTVMNAVSAHRAGHEGATQDLRPRQRAHHDGAQRRVTACGRRTVDSPVYARRASGGRRWTARPRCTAAGHLACGTLWMPGGLATPVLTCGERGVVHDPQPLSLLTPGSSESERSDQP